MARKLINMTGKRIGYLTVIERDGSDRRGHPLWKCQCDCGTMTYITGSNLRSGRVLSCGCYHKDLITDDITGKRFGKLVALRRNGSDRFHLALWDCKCDCGSEVTVRGTHLRSGKTQSCGCYNIEKYQGSKSPHWRGGISFGKYCHKFNNEFKEHIRNKFGRRCFLCGAMETNTRHDVHHIDYAKNSICNGKEWAFIPLCHRHHSMTGHNRWYWFNLFINYWIKEEWLDGIRMV